MARMDGKGKSYRICGEWQLVPKSDTPSLPTGRFGTDHHRTLRAFIADLPSDKDAAHEAQSPKPRSSGRVSGSLPPPKRGKHT